MCIVNIINKPHEGGMGISKVKCHQQPFIQAKHSPKGYFPRIANSHTYFMIGCCYVHFSKVFGTLKSSRKYPIHGNGS